jgi:hypothetical protein
MRVVIVPNGVSDSIYSKIDEKFRGITITAEERKAHFDTLLDFFDKYGFVPDFEIKKDTPKQESKGK